MGKGAKTVTGEEEEGSEQQDDPRTHASHNLAETEWQGLS